MIDKTSAKTSGNKVRAKYATAIALAIWVVAVFLFTIFKFSGGAK